MILIILPILFFLYIAKYYYQVSKYPKGPTPIPIFGNMLQVKTPQALENDLGRWKAEYGDLFTFWLFGEPVVVLNNYDLIREALITHGEVFVDRTRKFPETLFMHTENGGVTFSSGESWREQRRTALHILRDLGVGKNVMEQQVQEQLEQFITHVKNESNKDQINFRWPIQVLVANIINQLLYGTSYPFENCSRLMNFVTTLTKIFITLFENPLTILAVVIPWIEFVPVLGYYSVGKHVEQLKKCISHVREDVKNALEGFTKDDEPNCVAQAYYQKIGSNEHIRLVVNNLNQFYSIEQLYNVCSDFFIAGMETTTTTLRWGLLHLAKYQDIQEKLRREVVDVVGFDQLPSMANKNKMPYTTAFIAELQRTSNVFPVNLMRRNVQEVTINGYLLPKDTIVLPHIFEALKDEKLFPEPDQFRPERFLHQDGALDTDLINRTVIFGMGKRQCAGESLARVELFLGIATIVQKFKLFPSPGKEIDLTPIQGTVRFPQDQTLRIEEVNSLTYV